jgi:hypothetical protein
MAETFTDKLKLSKRDTGDLNWGTGHNANLEAVDQHLQQKTLRPPRTLLASLGSGAVGANLLGSTIYFYKVTAINAAGETTESQLPSVLETQISEPSTPVPIILQWEIAKGATGYRIYKSTSTGTEKFLAEVTGESALTYTDTGNTATNNGIPVPTSNTARTSVSKLIAGSGISLSPSHGTGDVTVNSTATGGVSSLRKTGSGTGLSGDVSLEEGSGIALTQDTPNNKINIANAGVTGLRKLGDPSALVGDVKLEAGTNITLTSDIPNNKITIAASGGGTVTGYQTQVVAAPTGVAATDTANIAAALSAAGTAGGGVVQLREGSYTINATLTIPNKVTLQGMGRDATTILCDAAMGAVNTIATSGNSQGLRDLKIDENQPGRAGGNPFVGTFLNGTNALVENCQFVRNKSSGSFIFLSNGGQMRNCIILNNGNALSTAMIQGGDLIECCTLTLNQTNGTNNDWIQGALQVMNCRLIRTTGSFSGAGIRTSTSNKIIVGNGLFVSSGNAIILSSGSNVHTVVGNIGNGTTILIESGSSNSAIVGNASFVITNNSGNSTNQLVGNT